MSVLNVNPTRIELTNLKKKLMVARKGHKLLKDKRDEMMRQFLDIVKENKTLRAKTEKSLIEAERKIMTSKAVMGEKKLTAALMLPKNRAEVSVEEKNVMSVNLPQFCISDKGVNVLPYGFANTDGELDEGISALQEALPDLIKLASEENAIMLLATEIEKTRRRVNALEHVMIPNYEDTIRYITMKLDEAERSNTARLMKVKDMMIEETIEEKHKTEAAE